MPMTHKQRAEILELQTVLNDKRKKYDGLRSILEEMEKATDDKPYQRKETDPPEIKALHKELDGLKGQDDKSSDLIEDLSWKSKRVCQSIDALNLYVDDILGIDRNDNPVDPTKKEQAIRAVDFLDSLRTKGTVVGEFFKALAELFVLIKRFFAPGQIGEIATVEMVDSDPIPGATDKNNQQPPAEKLADDAIPQDEQLLADDHKEPSQENAEQLVQEMPDAPDADNQQPLGENLGAIPQGEPLADGNHPPVIQENKQGAAVPPVQKRAEAHKEETAASKARVPTEKMFGYSSGTVAGRLFKAVKKHEPKPPAPEKKH